MSYQLRHVRLSMIACLLLMVVSSMASAVPVRAAERTKPLAQAEAPLSLDGLNTMPYPGDALDTDRLELAAAEKGGSDRLDGALLALTNGVLAAADAEIAQDDGGRVQVQVTVSPDEIVAAAQAMTDLGGSITGQSLDKTIIQGFMPVANIKALASQSAVQYIAAPEYLTTFGELQVGLTTTEGVAITNAAAWHAAGFRGSGVKVAIIDGGFQGYSSLLGSDLPASVVTANFADSGTVSDGGPHGTACAEIVYDMAPGATIYLIRISTNIDLQEAVTYAIGQGVRVISTSLGWYNLTPGDGTGFFANEVQRATNAGILWTTAAGNDREAHWGGPYTDADGDNVHGFSGYEINCFGPSPGSCYNLNPGFSFVVFLRWNNWTAPVNQDYDLYLVRWNGSSWVTIAGSTAVQNGSAGQRPTEAAIATTSGGATAYGIVIRRYSASGSANFEMFAPKFAPLSVRTTSRSLANLADAPAALTVAALNSVSPYAQESYSSEGPANGPGGAATGGAIKPDLSAFANVNTRSYGTTAGSKFNGTSSATPHVGGALALVRGAYPNFSWTQVRSFLFGRGIDIGAAGKDNQFGYGRLWLGAARLMRYDFNGDKRADLFWRNVGTGANAIWYMNGASSPAAVAVPSVTDLTWSIVAGGDFNGDGRSDVFWRRSTTGANVIWFMNGASILSSVSLPGVTSTVWRIVATGDFNGDSRTDIVWRNSSTGANALWFMNGSTILSGPALPSVPVSWLLVGTGDFNGDGRSDILWRHSSGADAIWFMNGASIISGPSIPTVTDANWRMVGTGDRNSDGRSDILWRNVSSGANAIWYMSGSTVISSVSLPTVSDVRWQVAHDGDISGDARADIVWRHATGGGNAVWLLNGSTLLSSASLPSVTDTRWRIQGNTTAGTAPASIDEAAGTAPEEMFIGEAGAPLEGSAPGEALEGLPNDSVPPLDETVVDVPATDYKTYLMQVIR